MQRFRRGSPPPVSSILIKPNVESISADLNTLSSSLVFLPKTKASTRSLSVANAMGIDLSHARQIEIAICGNPFEKCASLVRSADGSSWEVASIIPSMTESGARSILTVLSSRGEGGISSSIVTSERRDCHCAILSLQGFDACSNSHWSTTTIAL